ncbi:MULTISPECIES: DUF418 domain-containing protein [Saccharibacillus]|uniref:DUF418 domain-containing protein n=1 Tax=Saccharibacillus TaxID=456492 RepID=UPI001F44EDED|nr:DUF418 domain-containing protein [Saccharibacillus sp. WB 17]
MDRTKRVQLIDGLRGFSLAGILIANMLIFQYGLLGETEPQLFGIEGADLAFRSFLFIAVVGSFMPIFAYLFGFGMVKLADSLTVRELRPKWHLARRFLLLLGIGMLHATFLWEGDILTFYGMTGFFLLLFVGRKPKTLLIWAVLLMTVMGALGLTPLDPVEAGLGSSAHTQNYVLQSRDVYGTGTYAEIRSFRNEVDPFGEENGMFLLFAVLFAPILIAPMFLLGMRAARIGTFDDPQGMRRFHRRRAAVFIAIGLLLKAYGMLAPQLGGAGLPGLGLGDTVGGAILSLGYIHAFALLYAGVRRHRLLPNFEAVGRLSMTNYLMQSVIGTTIFYGYGFGLFGHAGVFVGTVIALAIYAAQLWLSPLYLRRFRTGPIEYVLRVWTYLSWRGRPKTRKLRPPSSEERSRVS